MDSVNERKLSPVPDAGWRFEEVAVPGMWVFDNLAFVADSFPVGVGNHVAEKLSEIRAVSYFDEAGKLARYELYRTHIYDKEYTHRLYEAVYEYGDQSAEVTYWDENAPDKVFKSTLALDANGLLVNDVAILYPPFFLPFGHAIEPEFTADPTWKRVEESWTSDHGNHKCLNVVYLGESNEYRRFERWLCDEAGNPYKLMREEQVQIQSDGSRYRVMNKGGYKMDGNYEPLYLTAEGQVPQKRGVPSWLKWSLILAGTVALLAWLMI